MATVQQLIELQQKVYKNYKKKMKEIEDKYFEQINHLMKVKFETQASLNKQLHNKLYALQAKIRELKNEEQQQKYQRLLNNNNLLGTLNQNVLPNLNNFGMFIQTVPYMSNIINDIIPSLSTTNNGGNDINNIIRPQTVDHGSNDTVSTGTTNNDSNLNAILNRNNNNDNSVCIKTEKSEQKGLGSDIDRIQYKCNYCNTIYNSKTTLDNHIKTHQFSSKQYKCNKCNKQFNDKLCWNKHSINCGHNNICIKPFSCKICESKFKEHTKLITHLTTQHKLSINNILDIPNLPTIK